MERIRHKIARIRENVALIRSIQDECRERFAADRFTAGRCSIISI